jgi:hypothetical protein
MSVDIVNLIENNPITKFSGDYQSKLVEKVKNNFTNYEQQLFLSSFYCYLKYDSKNDYVIDLDNIWQWLGFSQKIKAKILLENNFKIDINYKKLLSREGKQDEKTHGGHNKETFMLNIETFKKFCLKTGTKKADEIHDYFIKLENVMFEITKEESEELKKQILKLENTNKEMEKNVMKEKEKVLLDKFATSGPLIYIIKVKTYKSGEYVVKIGHSLKGVLDRYNEHKTKFDECLLLDCFSCDKSKDLESFIHHHKNIQSNKVTDLPRHTSDKELFLIGKDLSYQTLLKIIDNNISNYNYRVKELLLEIENLKLKQPIEVINNDNELLKELTKTVKQMSEKIDNLEKSNQQILNKLNAQETKIVTGFNEQMPHLGPRLQKINPETMQLITVYESVTELMNEDKNIKRPSINKAVIENTIYYGFRWQLVERNLDANIIHSLEPTKETKVQNLGYIAKLDANKSQIINVYLDRKSAANRNNYSSDSSLDYFVKNGTITNGYYYMLYDNCEQSLIDIFEKENGVPLLYKNGVGQYDLNKKLLREFSCKYDCIKELKMSDKTLNKLLLFIRY